MGCTTNYRHLSRFGLPWLVLLLSACTTPARYNGTDYVHLFYQHPALPTVEHLNSPITLVFIEGDGIPWVAGGTRPASDPTPIYALAFNLYKHTPQAAWFVTRPCYNGVKDVACTPLIWTHERYSQAVTDSMATAINSFASTHAAQQIVLVGYSGGGTLAALLATRVSNVVGIITIAANLDVTAWAELHKYEALTGSLNPAEMNESTVPQVVLVGDRDTNVPLTSITRYLQTHPHAVVVKYDHYDHICCWEKNWPAVLNTALAKLNLLRKSGEVSELHAQP